MPTRIVFVDGPSGSGKTTLLKNLASKTVETFDTDEYDDIISLILLSKPSTASLPDSSFNKLKDSHLKKALVKAIESSKKPTVVVAGVQVRLVDRLFPKTDVNRYFLNTPAEVVFRRVNLRHLEMISRNKKKIADLLKSSRSTDEISRLLLYLYKLRIGFPSVTAAQPARSMNAWTISV